MPGDRHQRAGASTESQNGRTFLRDSIRQRPNVEQLTGDLKVKFAGFEHVLRVSNMYCITLRNKFDKTIIGWYDASASNFSTDQRRAKLFVDRADADAVAYQLRRMYPRLTQDIEVTPAVQPTALVYSSNGRNRVAIV